MSRLSSRFKNNKEALREFFKKSFPEIKPVVPDARKPLVRLEAEVWCDLKSRGNGDSCSRAEGSRQVYDGRIMENDSFEDLSPLDIDSWLEPLRQGYVPELDHRPETPLDPSPDFTDRLPRDHPWFNHMANILG